MSIDLEYAIRTNVRNNPVVREADARHSRDLLRTLALVIVTVAMLLFSVWQRSNLELTGYQIERLRTAREEEMAKNRQLRLNVETLRAPHAIESRAEQLGLRWPTLAETLVIERAHEASPAGSVVARAQ
jgi:cell division protein FtsL